MLWLVLAVACSLAVAAILKSSERQGLDRATVLTANYAVASAVSALLLLGGERSSGALRPEAGLVVLGVVTGALFIAGFYVFARAIRVAGMGTAAGVMRLAVVLPFLASWLVWGERPTDGQPVGLALAAAAFLLLTRPAAGPQRPDAGKAASGGGLRAAAVLGLLFLTGGLVDVAMKGFDEAFAAHSSRSLFLLLVFGVAFLIGLGLVAASARRTGRGPRGAALGWGAALGLVNYGSAAFLLRALAALPGTFVFPAHNVAVVLGAAVLGVLVWGERLSRANRLGLGLAAAALFFLTPK